MFTSTISDNSSWDNLRGPSRTLSPAERKSVLERMLSKIEGNNAVVERFGNAGCIMTAIVLFSGDWKSLYNNDFISIQRSESARVSEQPYYKIIGSRVFSAFIREDGSIDRIRTNILAEYCYDSNDRPIFKCDYIDSDFPVHQISEDHWGAQRTLRRFDRWLIKACDHGEVRLPYNQRLPTT